MLVRIVIISPISARAARGSSDVKSAGSARSVARTLRSSAGREDCAVTVSWPDRSRDFYSELRRSMVVTRGRDPSLGSQNDAEV